MNHIKKFNEKLTLEYPYVPGEMHLYGFWIDDLKDGMPQNPVRITENRFLVDGYSFGDRMLEGVMFDVVFQNKEVVSIDVQEGHRRYFEDLNTTKWLKVAKDYVERKLKTGDEVDLPEDILEKYGCHGGFITDDVKYFRGDI